ncbi:MAG: hypothetical protein ABI685_10430 [Ferruginibacter sp.]
MNKILSGCLLILLFACNNQNSNPTEKKSKGNTVAADNASTGNCGSLILFKKGAVVEGTSYDANGKQTSKQTTTVNDVSEEGGMLVAKSTSLTNGAAGQKTINLVYKCDGTNIYTDLNEMLANFASMGTVKGDVKPVQFPLNISEGQTLPEASYTISMDRGAMKMDITSTVKNRTVGAKEKITTTAGSWDCYKVSSDMDSDVQGLDERTKKIMDAVKAKTKLSMIMWYTPEIGIVRTEMYSNGKLTSRTDITAIKN